MGPRQNGVFGKGLMDLPPNISEKQKEHLHSQKERAKSHTFPVFSF
jgi:hypothetical protein